MRIYRISGTVSDKDEITLNSAELKILGFVDGKRSIRQVIRDGGFGEYSVYKIIYSLLSSGLIEPSETQPPKPTPEPAQESRDYSMIIVTYNNILQLLFRNLESELGKQAASIFNQSKQVAASLPYEIFHNYHPKNSADVNTRQICREIAPLKNFEAASQLLINSFNEFLLNILSKVRELLGPKMAQQTIQDIEAALPGVNTALNQPNDKNHIIGEIKQVLWYSQEGLENK